METKKYNVSNGTNIAKENEGSAIKKIIIGAGIVAGAALAAWLLASPKSRKKAETKIKGWARDMQKEVAFRVKAISDISQSKYEEIIDEIKPKYETLKDVSAAELEEFSKELKSHWNHISKAVAKQSKAKNK